MTKPPLNLYLIKRRDDPGYDMWLSAVVAASSEKKARATHPNSAHDRRFRFRAGKWEQKSMYSWEILNWMAGEWSSPSALKVTLIGTAAPSIAVGVVHRAFRNG